MKADKGHDKVFPWIGEIVTSGVILPNCNYWTFSGKPT